MHGGKSSETYLNMMFRRFIDVEGKIQSDRLNRSFD